MRRMLPAILSALLISGCASLDPSGAARGDPARATAAYLDRIAALDDTGPMLHAVIAYDRDAVAKSRALAATGPLHGRAVLVKDNIETREWPTTAGSLALAANATGRDAPLISRLRAAGGVVLGKTNLSEWANMRGNRSTSGWSAVGGLTRNAHATDRNACGSSSGSAVAVAAGMAWAAIGTETDGSITCPASVNGVVGFKPTVGLVSRTHVVPISAGQDTAGPIARSVRDAALLLTAIAGRDPADPATAEADAHHPNFGAGIAGASLAGLRIGVIRRSSRANPALYALYEQALADMRRAGAELVDIAYRNDDAVDAAEHTVLLYEFREGIDAYLAGSPANIPARSLAELLAFNQAHAAGELRWFGQEIFEDALRANDRAAYEKARAEAKRLAGPEGIDRLLAQYHVDVLVAPTTAPAWPTDFVNGGNYIVVGIGTLPAVAGYPHLTVPMGAVERLPVGLSFVGTKWTDLAVMRAGAAYEAVRSAEVPAPSFRPWSIDGR